jgi:O-antigen/teichoic acid export membrane protein
MELKFGELKKMRNKIKNFLLWTQKWTKTDMLYLAKGGFWLGGGQILNTIISFLGTIAFANLLPEDIYGTYKYIISIIALLSIPTLSGINSVLVRAIARDARGDFFPAIKTKIKWGLLGSLASIALSFYYLAHDDLTLSSIFILAAPFIPLMETFNIYSSYLNGLKKFKDYSVFSQLSQMISVSTAVISIYFTKNIFLIFFVYFTSNTLIRLIFVLITVKKYPVNKKRDIDTISFGKNLSFINIIGTIAANIDKILIFTSLGAPEVAIYSLAIRPVDAIKNVFKNISILALPKLSQRSWEEIKKSAPEKMNKFLIILAPIALLWVIFAPFVFKIVFPKYLSAVLYSQVYAITLLLFPRIILAQSLIAQAAKKQIYTLNIITPLSKIILLALLLPFFKIWGAIFALLGSYTVNYIYLKIIMAKKQKILS